MNAVAQQTVDTQWDWWISALAGNRGELTRGDPKSGFYRDRQRACAIWRDDGNLICAVSSGFRPRNVDEIDDAFGFWCTKPITHEVYTAFVETGRWPDDIDPAPERGVGDNSASLEPHEAIVAEINDLKDRFATWMKSIGGKIASEEHNAKADKYAKAVGDLKAKAELAQKVEKAPWLEGGRKVDTAWKPTISLADDVKRAMLAPTAEYRRARAADEEKKRQAEIARQRAEQDKARQQGERPAPVSMPPPKATGLRTIKRVAFSDLKAFAAQISGMEPTPADFVEVCEKIARRMLAAGAQVQGAELIEERVPS